MKVTTFIIFLISFHIVSLTLHNGIIPAQTTYYISSSQGNDTNNGLTLNSAWRTISKLNSYQFNPGDIIKFERGEQFIDATLDVNRSGNSNSFITFTSYGSGNLPVIGDSLLGTYNTAVTIYGQYIVLDGLEI